MLLLRLRLLLVWPLSQYPLSVEMDPENAECLPKACRGDDVVVVFLWVLGAARDEKEDRGACSGTAGNSGASALVKVTLLHAPEVLGSIFADCDLRNIGGRALLLLLSLLLVS